jgi:cbb3-type cytochrome oxidase cytochrome c subunit
VDERGGTLGPDLSTIGSRVRREWLWSYLLDPFRDQPDTLMPRFTFGADEARDIASYLTGELVDPEAPAAPEADPVPGEASVAAGRAVFVKRGCFGCHRLPGTQGLAKIGPALAGIGDRAVEPDDFRGQPVEPSLPNWLYLKLRSPERMIAVSSMPTFALSDADRVSVVVALLGLPRRDPPASRVTRDAAARPWTPQGEVGAIVTRYRCLSCHEMQGAGGRLSTVPLDRVGSQLQPEYLRAFLREPGTVRVGLDVRMPRMNLGAQEAAAFADYAQRVLVDDRLAAWVPPPPGAEREGAVLYDRLGCRGCHQISGSGGYVGPDLTKVGRRLQPGWIAAWLTSPGSWKPGTLQPDYGLSAAEASSITAYLMTLRDEARPR